MRGSILLLLIVMFALIANIIAYTMSEDYRFFIKKIKYNQDIVYEDDDPVDDATRMVLVEEGSVTSSGAQETEVVVVSQEGFTFLDAIGREEKLVEEEELLPALTWSETVLLKLFEDNFVLTENKTTTSLFDITTEYPDEYREFANKHLSLYMFSSKSYDQVYSIFDVLGYELPYSLNETDSFGDASFFINLEGVYADDKVRIVFEHKNKAFGLKIKKDSYNTVKQILKELSAQK